MNIALVRHESRESTDMHYTLARCFVCDRPLASGEEMASVRLGGEEVLCWKCVAALYGGESQGRAGRETVVG